MREHGVAVTDLKLDECVRMMEDFIRDQPRLWNEDIGN
jgi:cytosine deaminase